VRILRAAALRPGDGLNVVVGRNGSGKTSLLEALHLLGTGRSFRTRAAREVIRRGESGLRVLGEVALGSGGVHALAVEKAGSGTRLRLDGTPVRAASQLARLLPLVLISPESQRLLSDGAALRRQLIDWALFHVEPAYPEAWQRYERARRQRNSSLRKGESRDSVAAWDDALATQGETLHRHRARYLGEVLEVLASVSGRLLGVAVESVYRRGWPEQRSLAEALGSSWGRDRDRGFTTAGPHRADLEFSAGGRAARSVLSRGEGKLFAGAVLLAQVAYLEQRCARRPVVMVDDLASELDDDSRRRLLDALRSSGAQVFVTAVARDLVDTAGWREPRVFHVERGEIEEVV